MGEVGGQASHVGGEVGVGYWYWGSRGVCREVVHDLWGISHLGDPFGAIFGNVSG